jgi:hypothetical protein
MWGTDQSSDVSRVPNYRSASVDTASPRSPRPPLAQLSKEGRCFGCAGATPLEIGRGIDPVVNVCWGCASVAIEMSTMSARRHTDDKRAATPTNRTSSAARAKTVGVIERWKAQLVAGHDLTAGEPATNDESDGPSARRSRDVHGLSDLGVLISLAILGSKRSSSRSTSPFFLCQQPSPQFGCGAV